MDWRSIRHYLTAYRQYDLSVILDRQAVLQQKAWYRSAAGEGNLRLLKVLVDSRTPDQADQLNAFQIACQHGHLEVAQWLTKRFSLTPANARASHNYALRQACGQGHLELVQWLTEYFKLKPDDARACSNWALRCACSNGHLELAQWLVRHFNLDATDARTDDNLILCQTSGNGHLGVVQWLMQHFSLGGNDARPALRYADANGQIALTDWLST